MTRDGCHRLLRDATDAMAQRLARWSMRAAGVVGMSAAARPLAWAFGVALMLLLWPTRASPDGWPEYQLKAAFLYDFALFTQWPADVGSTLNLCIHGPDPFGSALDALQGKAVGTRTIAVHRGAALADCQIVFISAAAIGTLPHVLEALHGHPVLTVADSPGAAQRGVALNMEVDHERIVFQANLRAARAAGVDLSSKLLRLATEVRQ